MARALCTNWTLPELWSQMEGIIVPELAGEGSELDVFQLQQQIRSHTTRQESAAKGKNWDSALESAIKDASSKGFGLVKAEGGGVDQSGSQVIPVSYFKSNFLDSMEEPIEDTIAAVIEGNELETDDRLYKFLVERAVDSVSKGSQQTGIALFDLEIVFARWGSITKYINPKEATGDVQRDFGILSTRIMHSEWQKMHSSKKDEIDKGTMPSKEDFSKAYLHAMRKAWALMPERFKSREEFDETFKTPEMFYESQLECFRTMFTPEAYMRGLLKDISYEAGVLQQAAAKVAAQSEKTVGKGGDTSSAISMFSASLSEVKAATLTRWLGGTMYEDGNRQHRWIVAENIYCRALERLAKAFGADRTMNFQTHLVHERGTLQLEKRDITDNIGKLRVGDPDSGRAVERAGKIDERIGEIEEALAKYSLPPPDSDFERVLGNVKREIKTLFGEGDNPISGKTLDDIRRDYWIHNQPINPIWDEISSLYTHLSIVPNERGEGWTAKEEKSHMTTKAWDIAHAAIKRSRQKHRNTTENAFGELMSDLRTELKKVFLNGARGEGRYEYYDNIKYLLGDKKAVKNFTAEHYSGMFQFLVNAAFRHYDEGRIDRKKAEELLDRIRDEEIAYSIYFSTCTEVEEALKDKKTDANEDIMEKVRMSAVSKARVLMPGFKSAIERKYPARTEPDEEGRMLAEKTRSALLYDFTRGNYFNEDATANRSAGSWQNHIEECALPIAWVGLWQNHGDARLSAEQMHEAYRKALTYAAAFDPRLAAGAGINTSEDIERIIAQERGEKTPAKYMKSLRRQHLPRYMETIRRHKQRIEEMYFSHDNLVPRQAVAAGYAKTWIDEKVRPRLPVIFFKV